MRLLLIDDHVLFSQSLRFLLAELNAAIQCVTAASITEALQAEGPFDLILLDFNLPDNTGFAGLHTIRSLFVGTPVALLSGEENTEIIRAAIDEGAMGFVPKSASPHVLMAAIGLILAGGAYLPPHALTGQVPNHTAQPAAAKANEPQPHDAKPFGLSDRQLEVLLKAVQGKPNKIIARELNLAEGTVKSHLSIAFRVMGVNNRTEAVFRVAQLGLTMPSA